MSGFCVCVFCVSGVALATDRDLSQDPVQQGNVRLGPVQQRTVEQLAVLVRAGLMEEIVAEAKGFDEAAVFSRDAELLRCRAFGLGGSRQWQSRLFLHPATGRLRFTMRRAATRTVLGRPGL